MHNSICGGFVRKKTAKIYIIIYLDNKCKLHMSCGQKTTLVFVVTWTFSLLFPIYQKMSGNATITDTTSFSYKGEIQSGAVIMQSNITYFIQQWVAQALHKSEFFPQKRHARHLVFIVRVSEKTDCYNGHRTECGAYCQFKVASVIQFGDIRDECNIKAYRAIL